jgi:hypothetical protein
VAVWLGGGGSGRKDATELDVIGLELQREIVVSLVTARVTGRARPWIAVKVETAVRADRKERKNMEEIVIPSELL